MNKSQIEKDVDSAISYLLKKGLIKEVGNDSVQITDLGIAFLDGYKEGIKDAKSD